MSELEKGQECFLHKGNDSKIFVFGTVEYKEALKDGYVSDKAEAKRLFQEEIAKEALRKAKEAEEQEALTRFDVDEDAKHTEYRKTLTIEVVAFNNQGDALVQNKGDSSNRWVIDSETFNNNYEVIEGGSFESSDDIKPLLPVSEVEGMNLEKMKIKELRKLAKDLGICCVSKSSHDEVVAKINELIGKNNENKDNTDS